MKKLIALLGTIVLCLLTASALSESTEQEIPTSIEYEYTLLENGTAEITRYTGETENLIIPQELDGYEVTAISGKAFSRCRNLTTIKIPDSVTTIEDRKSVV